MGLGREGLKATGPEKPDRKVEPTSSSRSRGVPGEGGWESTSKLDYVWDFSADHTARKSLSWKMTLSAGTGP